MELESKPDFDKALERFEAWWHCELIDRPLVTLSVKSDRRPSKSVPPKTYSSLRDKWFDMDYLLDWMEAWTEAGVYLAETVPMFMPNLGPEVVATTFGSELEFSKDSSWSKPIVKNCAEILGMKPNLDTVYWNTIRKATEQSVERGKGKWLTGITDLHTNIDLVAALREPQDLCLDCLTDLDMVAAADDYVTQFFPLFFEDLYKRIEPSGQPCTSWCTTLHAGRSHIHQADFICMMSPEMFQRAVLPQLVEETKHVERSIYHLDGPGALQHLDALLACPHIQGLQWVCGDGHDPASRWIDLYQKTQAAGKCIQVLYTDMNDAKILAEHIKPEGVWFTLGGLYTREEAEDFLKWAERWAAGKRV